MNKKAFMGLGAIGGMIVFITILAVILLGGFAVAIVVGTADIVMTDLTPAFEGLGQAGETNLTEVSEVTITPINTVVQAFPWIVGVLYVMMLIGSIGFASLYRGSGEKFAIIGFLGLVMLLILLSILVSNMYQDLYEGDDDLALRLQEQTLLSFMILYSPGILTIIAFIGGALMFSGVEDPYVT